MNLDSPNHKVNPEAHIFASTTLIIYEQSHMTYPLGPPSGSLFMNGTCPTTHPVRVPLLFMETVWDTRPFNDMWPTDGTQPFVYSQGDP